MTPSESSPLPERRERIVLRRYQAVCLMLSVLLFGSVSLFSRSTFDPVEPRYPYRIALTFDDGPHPGYTERLLDVLREERVAATFFVVGKQAERNPGLLRSIARQGHEIANHTYNHPNLTRLAPGAAQFELDDTRRIVFKLTGREPRFFRPPGGQYNLDLVRFSAEKGYRMVLWSVLPKDHMRPPADVIRAEVVREAHDGAVVLLHSGIDETIAALPGIIQDLRARGYQFLTVAEMLQEDLDPMVLAQWFLPKSQPVETDNATPIPLALVRS